MAEARDNLSRFPELGRSIASLPVPGSRRLVVGDYVLDYNAGPDGIVIVSVFHGRQEQWASGPDENFDYESGDHDPNRRES